MADEDLTDDDETVIGVVVGIEGSNLEDVDPSVTPIDTSDELLTAGFLLCDTGFASSVAVLDEVDSKVSLLLPLLLETLWLSEDESLVEVGSGDASVMPVLPDKLGDGESVTYDVEKELLTVLVAVVGVTVGMDDKTEEDDDKVLSFASLLLLSPPPGFAVASSATDDELSTEDDNDELSRALDLTDDVVYLRLVVDSENFVSVTAMVVPVDRPGVKVIVSGNLLLVVERTDSEVIDEVIPFEDDCDDMGVVLP